MPVLTPQVFEALMLICFGISWPLDILNTLRLKQSSGKSQLFMGMILFGYAAGVTAKLMHSALSGQPPQWVTWLYVLNMALVATDMGVSWVYKKGA
jgi:hypothetical protein